MRALAQAWHRCNGSAGMVGRGNQQQQCSPCVQLLLPPVPAEAGGNYSVAGCQPSSCWHRACRQRVVSSASRPGSEQTQGTKCRHARQWQPAAAAEAAGRTSCAPAPPPCCIPSSPQTCSASIDINELSGGCKVARWVVRAKQNKASGATSKGAIEAGAAVAGCASPLRRKNKRAVREGGIGHHDCTQREIKVGFRGWRGAAASRCL